MQMAIPLYLTTIEQDIFDTFRYLPHAVAVGVGFVTVAAAWKNQQMIKKQKRLEHAHSVPGTQLLLWFLVAVYFAMMLSITLFSREPGSRTGVDVKLFETWGNQRLPDRYFVENPRNPCLNKETNSKRILVLTHILSGFWYYLIRLFGRLWLLLFLELSHSVQIH